MGCADAAISLDQFHHCFFAGTGWHVDALQERAWHCQSGCQDFDQGIARSDRLCVRAESVVQTAMGLYRQSICPLERYSSG